jgi:hypothetical protein
MVECIFTLDYEIYGNGTGALKDLVYEPTERLKQVFLEWDARFVNYVEVAEFDRIEACGSDRAIDLVKKQIKELYQDDFECALHLHPQWYNAGYERGQWHLDYSEYNLCTLPRARVTAIVERALAYMRHVIGRNDYVPLSFRAGNWLFQPSATAAGVLSERGIKIDSSVFKGGVQHNHGLDYRSAQRNGYFWSFSDDVTRSDATGRWIEVPIHAEMVPIWRMATSKRVSSGNAFGGAVGRSVGHKIDRLRDFVRLRYPLKFDFCRMTFKELTSTVDRVLQEDHQRPEVFRPMVAIGHSKDPTNFRTVSNFLGYLRARGIPISTFRDVYPKLLQHSPASHSAGPALAS